jgi:EAL domain-containing protein (putative c-di-GMP-specific phosphodiesterase class I)
MERRLGRNTFHFFNADMQNVVMKRAALEHDLRVAIKEQHFTLYYQAQLGHSDLLIGAEVLIRWHHPERGMVSPLEFIPLAEETGLILPLGQWVLQTACTQLAIWAEQPEMAHLTISVNVSAHQFYQADFVEQVLQVIESTGAKPHRLKLEITESMLVRNIEEIVAQMSLLKAKGISFSLDDFGTGYSSLAYLQRMPLDQLKIDQSFVRDIATNPSNAAIAKTIIGLSKSLGFSVIAEGVETPEQLDYLAQIGCHFYQGYFFNKPLPLADFEKFALKTS